MEESEGGGGLSHSLPLMRSSIQSPAASPNTSQQLGKYITNGLEMLSLSEMKIVVDRPLDDGTLDDVDNGGSITLGESEEGSSGKDDCVYLANIYETYSKLNEKVDRLFRREYFDRAFVRQVLRDLCNGEYRRVKERIWNELKERDLFFPGEQSMDSVEDRVYRETRDTVYEMSLGVKDVGDELRDMETLVTELRRVFLEVRSRSVEAELGHSRATGDLAEQVSLCSREMRDLRHRLEEIGEEHQGVKMKLGAEHLEDVVSRYEEMRSEVERLRGENMVFSENMARMSEENERLRRECSDLDGRLRKITDASKRRGATIGKQRKMIDVLQSKVGGEHVLPTDELQMKIEELWRRIDAEEDMDRREKLVRDVTDYERRMADFLLLMRREDC